MRIEEKTGLRGAFRFRVWKDGTLVEESGDRNMIVDGARFEMARLVAGDAEDRHIVAIALGTVVNPAACASADLLLEFCLWQNSARNCRKAAIAPPPAPGDTAITDPFVKAVESVEYPAPGQARFNWLVAANEANGMAVMEFGLICADGTLFARYVRKEPLNKDSDFLLEGDWTIEF
jgi:hypothetical protein